MSGTGWGGATTPKGLPTNPTTTPIGSAIWGQGTPQYKAYTDYLPAQAAGPSYNSTNLNKSDWDTLYGVAAGMQSAPRGPTPVAPRGGSGGGGGGGYGGGGGGGAAAPQLNQGMLDWYTSMLRNAKPYSNQFQALTMPQWNDVNISPFDNSMYSGLRDSLGQAVASDRATASGAYDSLSNYLQSNYSNPYSNATYATSQNVPGQTQLAMQRMLQAQGQSPQMASDTYRQGQTADQGFGNLLALLGTNEDTAQRNRLGAVQTDRNWTNNMLNMAQLQGQTGIGLQEGQAKQAWQGRADDRALLNAQTRYQGDTQGALANWQRANEVGDTNNASQSAYYNSVISALTGLLPSLIAQGGSLNLPDYAALGLT